MIIDGHKVVPLPTGQLSVTTDGVETAMDHDAALRYLQQVCEQRAAYELQRQFNQVFGGPK
jgi:hypothetical protein